IGNTRSGIRALRVFILVAPNAKRTDAEFYKRFFRLYPTGKFFYKYIYIMPPPFIDVLKSLLTEFCKGSSIWKFFIGYPVGIKVIVKMDGIEVIMLDGFDDRLQHICSGLGNPGIIVPFTSILYKPFSLVDKWMIR